MRAIAIRLVVSCATHLLSLVDEPAEHRKNADRKAALSLERRQLEEAHRYYEEIGLRQAQLVYLFAMLLGAAGIAAVAWLTSGSIHDPFTLAAMLGAAGAVLSVMDRMSGRRRKFELDYELGTMPLVVLGALRPLLGAGFGLVVYAALRSGVVNLDLQKGADTREYLDGLLSFAAGWSERFAKDVLDAAESTVGAAVRARPAPRAEAKAPEAVAAPDGTT